MKIQTKTRKKDYTSSSGTGWIETTYQAIDCACGTEIDIKSVAYSWNDEEVWRIICPSCDQEYIKKKKKEPIILED